MKSGGGLGPAAPLCHGRCETDGVGGTDGGESSELRPGQQSKPRSPSRAAGPLTHLHRTESQQRKTTQPRALCRLILFIVSE